MVVWIVDWIWSNDDDDDTILQLNTTEGRDGNGAERYYHSERGGDDAEGQRRSDGYTFLMLSVCALRSGRVSGLVPRTLCISLVLHDR